MDRLGTLRSFVAESYALLLVRPDLASALKALRLARMISFNSRTWADEGRVLQLLKVAGECCGADHYELALDLYAEGLAGVSLLADDGLEMADQLFPLISERAPAEVVLRSKDYRERLLREGCY